MDLKYDFHIAKSGHKHKTLHFYYIDTQTLDYFLIKKATANYRNR